jgi:ribosomal protein S18 acetylase RimI-like enzyme
MPIIEKYLPNNEDCKDIIQKLLIIENNSFESTIAFNAEVFAEELQTNKLLLAKNDEGDIVGYCMYSKNSNSLHIESLAVHPKARGDNLGMLMIKKATELEGADKIGLECRPKNEGYYQKFGFKTQLLESHFYKIKGQWLPGIHMQTNQLTLELENKSNTEGKRSTPYSENEYADVIEQIKAFVAEIKSSTSVWYKYRSARKEKALDAIHSELSVADAPLSQEAMADILRGIIANACISRSGSLVPTKSAQKALQCLQSSRYPVLKNIISANANISMDDLRRFSDLTSLSSKGPNYPYTHYMRKSMQVIRNAEQDVKKSNNNEEEQHGPNGPKRL